MSEAGFLEFIDKEFLTAINGENRYKSNLLYYQNFSNLETSSMDIQSLLEEKVVLLLGLGGASIIAASLAGMGIGKIIGVDFDVIDKSNLSRQFLFNEETIGKNKTDITKQFIHGINPDIDCIMYDKKITDISDISRIIDENKVDIVINGLDDPAVITSRWVNNACKLYEIPMIQAGVSQSKLIIEMFFPKGACFDCVLKNGIENDVVYAGYITHYIFTYFLRPEILTSSFVNIIDTRDITKAEVSQYSKRKSCITCNSKNLLKLQSIDNILS